jgi:hypothetical protein
MANFNTELMQAVGKVAVASRAANRAKDPDALPKARRELQILRAELQIQDLLTPSKDGYEPLPFEDRKRLANLLVEGDGFSVQKKRK